MRKTFLFLILLSNFSAFSQEDAWVYFNVKPDSQFYFDNPLEMLTQRALDRRNANGVSIDLLDIPIHQPFIDQIDAVAGIEVMAKSKWLNAVHVRGSVDAIAGLASFDFVESIDFADHSLNTSGKIIKAKAGAVAKVNETQVEFPYGNSANQIQMLNGHLLHQQDYTGQGKIIAVLDSGFPEVDVVQPFARLRDNNLILGGYNFVDRNDDIYSRNSHGTLVLSTMGGFTANQLVGTAPDASYYLFITEDVNSENPVEESYWVEAAEAADSLGVDVINSSLGYFAYDDPDYSYSYEDMDGTVGFASRGADIAFSRGIVVVISAGNSGNGSEPHIGVPGDAVNVLTVGAVTPTEQYASFSSIGPSADGRIKPDIMAQGQSAVLSNTLGNITTASGTSFSSPIMAGMIASFWQAAPFLTHEDVVQIVKQSSHLYENPTIEMGYGIPDFQMAVNIANLAIVGHDQPRAIVYPNPVASDLFISIPGLSGAEITIYNDLGQKVLRRELIAEEKLNLQAFPSGIYFYRIISSGTVYKGKLLKS